MNPYDPQRQQQAPPMPPQQPPGTIQQWQQPPYWRPAPQVAPKSVGVAFLVSFFLPGVGSIVAGDVAWGVTILVLWLVSIPLTLVTIGFFTGAICWIAGMIAAPSAARRWNREHGIIS